MSTALSATQHLSGPPDGDQCADWKQQLAERLDAYRAKHPDTTPSLFPAHNSASDTRAARIARAVASRYAAAPTYSELLAAQAQRAAEEAARVQGPAPVQPSLPMESAAAAQATAAESDIAPTAAQKDIPHEQPIEPATPQQAAPSVPGVPVLPQFAARNQEMRLHHAAPEPEPSLEDLWATALVEPRTVLPSKLIEFPRELISPQKARPRHPEVDLPPDTSQLRIFEVQPEAVETPSPEQTVPVFAAAAPIGDPAPSPASSTPEKGIKTPSPRIPASTGTLAPAYKNLEWASISLDREPAVPGRKVESSVEDCVPFLMDPASIDRRVMAFAVDFALVTAAFLAFLLVFAAATPHLPTGMTAIAVGGVVYLALWVLYQMLFFSLSGATAGMLYAHIALCTFDDQNPSRRALRQRLAAWWLSCLPLGLGFLWCFVDEDNLGWHDRISRMYQREY